MSGDLPLEQDNHRSQNVGHCNVIAAVACLVLDSLVINDIALDYLKTGFRNLVGLQILLYCLDGVFIQVGSQYRGGPQLQGRDSQNPASGSHIQHPDSGADMVP